MIRSLSRPFLTVSFFFAVDKALALLRQVLIARAFGVSPELDSFNAANNLPDLIFAVISGGAMAVAIVPILTETIDRDGRHAAWALFSRVANWAFLATAVLAALLAIFAEPVIRHLVVPSFTLPQQLQTAGLMRLDLIALLIFSLSGLVIGSLQSFKHFFFPALAPVLYNVGMILGLIFFVPPYGIQGLAYGTILGAAMHLAIQIPALLHFQFRWSPSLDFRHPGVLKAARLMGPRVLTVAAIQAIFVTTDNFASGMGSGAITALAYGWLIMQVPETLIGSALGTVLLPTLSEMAERGERGEVRQLIRRVSGILFAVTVPVAIAAILVMPEAVRLVFEGRAFTAEGTALVSAAARLFLLGLPIQCLVEVAARSFYAHQDARTPLFAAALTAAVFISLCFLLTPVMGFAGIALANTLAFTAELILLAALLRRRQLV